jgi:hypothetical protein
MHGKNAINPEGVAQWDERRLSHPFMVPGLVGMIPRVGRSSHPNVRTNICGQCPASRSGWLPPYSIQHSRTDPFTRTHRANGKPPSCRWTMAIPSFSMETTPTNSQTFPRSQWADGRSSRVAKNTFQGKLKLPRVQNTRFSDRTPTISERSSGSTAHSLDLSLFSWPNLSIKTKFHPFSPCNPSIPVGPTRR